MYMYVYIKYIHGTQGFEMHIYLDITFPWNEKTVTHKDYKVRAASYKL